MTWVSDDEIVAAVERGARLSREVGEVLGMPKYPIRESMRRLAKQGRIRKVGYLSDGTTVVYGPADRGRQP